MPVQRFALDHRLFRELLKSRSATLRYQCELIVFTPAGSVKTRTLSLAGKPRLPLAAMPFCSRVRSSSCSQRPTIRSPAATLSLPQALSPRSCVARALPAGRFKGSNISWYTLVCPIHTDPTLQLKFELAPPR